MKSFVLILLLGVLFATFMKEARLQKSNNLRRLVRRQAEGSCRICILGETGDENNTFNQTGKSKEVCGNFCVVCPHYSASNPIP
ncbi:hypothetical protein CHUAL_009867 [Chamberlinius hualienensis]